MSSMNRRLVQLFVFFSLVLTITAISVAPAAADGPGKPAPQPTINASRAAKPEYSIGVSSNGREINAMALPDSVKNLNDMAIAGSDPLIKLPVDPQGLIQDKVDVRRFVQKNGVDPDTVHGSDDRTQVGNTTSYPWRAIAHLEIAAADGNNFTCTGWFIGPHTVATAGHCVYLRDNGGWANSIRVIPGRNGNSLPYGSQYGSYFWSVKGWTNDGDSDYDYGAIILPNNNLGNATGWFGFASYSFFTLLGMGVNTAGYPGDKAYGTMWFDYGHIYWVGSRRIQYDMDTAGGQSGSPVWRLIDGNRYGVAVHTNGGDVFNSGTRITDEVFNNFKNWKN